MVNSEFFLVPIKILWLIQKFFSYLPLIRYSNETSAIQDARLSFHRCTFKDVRVLHTYFFKVEYIIIQAMPGGRSMKISTVTDEKIFRVYKAFDRKK